MTLEFSFPVVTETQNTFDGEFFPGVKRLQDVNGVGGTGYYCKGFRAHRIIHHHRRRTDQKHSVANGGLSVSERPVVTKWRSGESFREGHSDRVRGEKMSHQTCKSLGGPVRFIGDGPE